MRSQPPESMFAVRQASPTFEKADGTPVLDLLLDAAREFHLGTHVGISVVRDGGVLTTLAATSSLVFALDQLQHDVAEGPSITAMQTGHTVIVDDVESEHRWDEFTRRAVDLGLCSVLVLPLSLGNNAFGVVNLYSPTHAPLSAQSLDQASLFASQAAMVVSQVQRERQLLLALQSSHTVGAATGQVMERFCIDGHEAHAYLERLAQCSGATLLEISAQFVEQASDRWRSKSQSAPPLHRTGGQHLTVLSPDASKRPDVP